MAGLFKRGHVWWGRVQRKGKEYRTSLETGDRQLAQDRFEQWVKRIKATGWGEKVARTYDEAVRKFILEHLPTLKVSAAQRYAISLKALNPTFSGKLLSEITSALLSEFEAARRSAGVSPSTIRRDLACLSSMLTSCEDWEWIADGANPVKSYMRRRAKRGLKEAPPRTRYLTEGEEARLLAECSPTVRAAVVLALDTGLRRGELFSLTWSQVDLARGLITTTTDTKNGRSRKVPLPERSRTNVGTLIRHTYTDYVFVNRITKKRYTHMLDGLKGAAERAGIKDLKWHDLRRTAGCRWLQNGRSMEEVSVMLGHSGVQVTQQRYAFLEGEQVAESVAARKA